MQWVLIAAWTLGGWPLDNQKHAHYPRGIAMQEFNNKESCQAASAEAQKIADGLRTVCVPKGSLSEKPKA